MNETNYSIADSIFKVGDKVFDHNYGWGIVTEINIDSEHPIIVLFNEFRDIYTFDGRFCGTLKPTLSFTEYKIEGFSQESPRLLPNKGDIVWVRDSDDSQWLITHFMFKKDNMYFVSDNCSDNFQIRFKQLTTENPYKNEQ